jgi:phage shock protein E
MKKIILLLLLFTTKLGISQNESTAVVNVSSEEFRKLTTSQKGIIIDLRTNEEIASKGMIPNAMQIDYLAKDAGKEIENLDRNKTYYIYCAAGGRSGRCASQMSKLGFKKVVNLSNGFDDWKNKGFEVHKR